MPEWQQHRLPSWAISKSLYATCTDLDWCRLALDFDLGVYKTIRGYLSVCKYNEILPLTRHPLQWDETSGRIPADAQLIGL